MDLPDNVIHLVTSGYIPVPESELAYAEKMISDLRAGILTGFVFIAVGPETSGRYVGYTGGRMDRMQLLGNLAVMCHQIVKKEEDAE